MQIVSGPTHKPKLHYQAPARDQLDAKLNKLMHFAESQRKVLNRLLDGDFSQGINATQYQRMAKVSKATATRHLSALVDIAVLCQLPSGGRSTRYVITLQPPAYAAR